MSATPKALKPKHVRVEDLAIGQKISGRVFSDEVTVMKRPVEVKTMTICPGQWRTHWHINGGGCWDGRTLVVVG